MCNACGFHCCGSDQFTGCGCDHCDEPDCWSDDDFDDDYMDLEDDYEIEACACRSPSQFQCVESV